MLTLEQASALLEALLNLSLPIMILSGAVSLVIAYSIIRIIISAFDSQPALGIIMLLLSPLMLFVYIGMALFYTHIEVKELLALLVTHQDAFTISVISSWGLWFWIAWLKIDLFAVPLARMICVIALYVLTLTLLEQFPLFDDPPAVPVASQPANS